MFKKIIFSFAILLSISSCSYAMNFIDIPQGFWAYGQIDSLTDEGLISGYEDYTFRPENYITRAEYATMLIKAIGKENMKVDQMYTFEDISNTHWAWNYIIRALNLDIVKPASESYFYPDDFVTRREIITFLVNILKTEHITKKEALNALQNAYLDFDDIPDWFKVTAGKAEVLGVIAKEPPREQYLDCEQNITRAQMAVFLANLKEKIESYKQEKIKEATSPKIGEGIIIENVYRQGDVVTIPTGSVLPIMVMGQISSDSSAPGQMFQAKFANNIIDYEHNILLSKDIILIGKILETTKSKNFIRNGEISFELSAANNKNNLVRIEGYAEYEASLTEANKIKKAGKTILKGREFIAKDGQILYIKLFKPMRVNIVTGDVLD